MYFDPERIRTKEERKKLALEFVDVLCKDTTQPVSHFEPWIGYEMLQDFEFVAGERHHLFQEFADFCYEAQLNTANNPSVEVLFMIYRTIGLCCLSPNERPNSLILFLFNATLTNINFLEESNRKSKLAQLRSYWLELYNLPVIAKGDEHVKRIE